VVALGVGSMLYVGGGAAYAARVQGREVKQPADVLAVHPHRAYWSQLSGLVADGVVEFRTRVDAARAGQGEGYEKLPAAAVAGRQAAEAKAPATQEAPPPAAA
jgi:hypothetical protein